MKLKQLSYFMAIAEEHQITAAARKLHIAQPPLTYELKELEDEMGVKLVKRGARQAELTDAGRLLYKRASQILAMTATAAHEVQSFGKGFNGVLSIGAISSSGGLIPNKAMRDFTAHYPDVRFDIHEGNTFEIIEMLANGIIDLGIVRTPFSHAGLQCRYGPSEDMMAVMDHDAFGIDPGAVTVAELSGAPLVMYRRFEQLLKETFAAQGSRLVIGCLNDDARTTCNWAAKGFGIGIVPASILTTLNTNGLIVKRIACDTLQTRLAVVWDRQRYLSPLAQRFVTMFDGQTESLSEQ